MEIPAQVLKVLWDHYDYGGDQEFLRRWPTPGLTRETAIFLRPLRHAVRRRLLPRDPDAFREHWGWTKNFERNRDSTSALCMFRWLLNTTADALGIAAAGRGSP